jgi:DNA excision repair protein ERCC-2
VQAAGRVIRSDTDQGVMVFAGERFARADNTALLKALWPDIQRVTSLPELTGSLERFWGRVDENR